jgi:hypothetical protein
VSNEKGVDVIAALLDSLRERGIELRVDGSRLKVSGDARAYSPALRAKLLALKPEIVAHLQRDAEASGESYEHAVRAWESEYVTHLARGRGYAEDLVSVALEIASKRPHGEPFSVGANLIVVSMGEGREVRIHRTPQDWAREDS